MTKFEVSLVALSAFCLGFVASEYRGHYIANNADEPARVQAEGARASGSAYRESLSYGSNAVVDSITSAHDNRHSEPSFSWERINALLQARDYDRALALLKDEQPVSDNPAAIWLALAHIYQQTNKPYLLVEAWLRYLDEELDAEKSDQVNVALKAYLTKIFENPLIVGGDNAWLAEQITGLLDFRTNDGELHWMLASLYLQEEDSYQAQYHALMAANDPVAQKRAEKILAQLNGADVSGEHLLPLIRYGNQYLVNVAIDGHAARLLLDTGASLSGVSQDYIARYPHIVTSKKTIRLNTASGTEESYLFTIDVLTMGDLRFSAHILARLPMTNVPDFDGLLGVDILGRFDFVIDQDKLQLRLTPRT